MRKKSWIIVIAIFIVCLGGGLFLCFFKASTGIYIAAGSPVIVFDGGSGEPVVMLGRTGDEMFSNLQTGDRILIIHDGTMMLSYPAQMNVRFCIRLKKGDQSSVPEEAMESLRELGWL